MLSRIRYQHVVVGVLLQKKYCSVHMYVVIAACVFHLYVRSKKNITVNKLLTS